MAKEEDSPSEAYKRSNIHMCLLPNQGGHRGLSAPYFFLEIPIYETVVFSVKFASVFH